MGFTPRCFPSPPASHPFSEMVFTPGAFMVPLPRYLLCCTSGLWSHSSRIVCYTCPNSAQTSVQNVELISLFCLPFGIPIFFLSITYFFIILYQPSISFQRQYYLFHEIFSHLIHLLKKHLMSSFIWQEERVKNKTDAVCVLIELII